MEAFSKADREWLAFIVEQGGSKVAAQSALFIAADARANGLLAVSATLAAAGLAVAVESFGDAGKASLRVAASAFTVGTSGAAALSVWALWPRRVAVQGWSPELFEEDALQGRKETELLAETAAILQRRINRNDCALVELGWRARFAMALLAATPATAASVAGLQSVLFVLPSMILLGAIAAAFGVGIVFHRADLRDVRKSLRQDGKRVET